MVLIGVLRKKSILLTTIMPPKKTTLLYTHLISELISAKKSPFSYSSKSPAHLAGLAVPVGGGTGQEMVVGGRAPTPAAEAATTAECPVQIRENGQIRERILIYELIKII